MYILDYVKLFNYYYNYYRDPLKTNNMSHEMSYILAAYGKEERMIRTEELLARRIADHNRFVTFKNNEYAIDI